jgi:hypothetical protein
VKTARFWVWVNDGWVKLSIPPGQCLTWSEAHPTDEGWSGQSQCWTNTGEEVILEWTDEGRDCDGFISHEGTSTCPIEQLRARDMYSPETWGGDPPTENKGIFAPEWEHDRHSVYDEEAVKAGY